MQRSLPIPAWVLLLTRVTLGASFFFSDHGTGEPGELARFLAFAQKRGFGWYTRFLEAVVIPRTDLFGTLVLVGELYVGIALVLGVTTRLAAGVAIFLCLNYLCAKGQLPWGPGIDSSDILLALIVLVTAAGRTVGIDRFLADRFPRVPIW
jgi:uncharacterized membrane protein YphA (DoxX/SURF4 family)